MLRTIDLRKLNSLTKYPPILTYHAMGKRGRLAPERTTDFAGEQVVVTEKIDGANSRIILLPDGTYIIGSREELLYAQGDVIGDRSLGIVDALRDIAEEVCANVRIRLRLGSVEPIYCLYLETFGGNIGKGAKQYTTTKAVSFRLFDVVQLNPVIYGSMLELPIEQIASWRQNGGQLFLTEDELPEWGVPLTPRIDAPTPPETIVDTLIYLHNTIKFTRVALDDKAKGRPEGVVIRTPDRIKIAKLRFEDYERR